MREFDIFITSFRRKPVVARVRGATNSFNLVAAPDFQRLSSVLAANNYACSFSSNGRLLLSVFKRINNLYAGRGKVLDVACHNRCAVAAISRSAPSCPSLAESLPQSRAALADTGKR